MKMSDVDEILFKETLINAYKYGTADKNIVLKKIMANYPNLRSKAKELAQKIEKIVKEENPSISTPSKHLKDIQLIIYAHHHHHHHSHKIINLLVKN